MSYFELRYVLLMGVNILKPGMLPWEWDPFHVFSNPSGFKFWFLVLTFILFSFISIKIPFRSPLRILMRVENFSASMMISSVALLFLPQTLFWYFYPMLVLSSLSSNCLSTLFNGCVFTLQAVLSMTPGLNIYFATTNANQTEPTVELEEVRIAEDGTAQV